MWVRTICIVKKGPKNDEDVNSAHLHPYSEIYILSNTPDDSDAGDTAFNSQNHCNQFFEELYFLSGQLHNNSLLVGSIFKNDLSPNNRRNICCFRKFRK